MLLVFIFLIILLVLSIEFKLYINIIDNKSNIVLKVYVLKKILITKLKLNQKSKQDKNRLKSKLKSKIRKDLKKQGNPIKTLYKYIKNSKLYLEKLDLNIKISSNDAIVTTSIVFIISTIITFLLKAIDKSINYKNCKYKITPLYLNRKILNINLNCIITINMVHIISIIYKKIKEWRCDKNERRASNRKFNANSNEQHKRNDRCKYNYRRSNKSTR